MARGIIAIGIDKDDELIAARITDGSRSSSSPRTTAWPSASTRRDVRSMGRPAYGVRGIDLVKNDYVVGRRRHSQGAQKNDNGGDCACLILSVTENGLRQAHRRRRVPPADARRQGRHQHEDHGAQRQGQRDPARRRDIELMVISQFGKIIRIDTKTIRAAGRSTQGVRLLNLDDEDKVAAAVVIPPEEAKIEPENGTLLQ